MEIVKINKGNKKYEIKGKTSFWDSSMQKNGYNARSIDVKFAKSNKHIMNIRVDYSLQEKSGSTYRSLLHKLEVSKTAIKEHEFEALLILINKEFIPEEFIEFFLDKIKEDRFIYVKVYDGRPEDDIINTDIVDMSEALVQLKKAESKMKKLCTTTTTEL